MKKTLLLLSLFLFFPLSSCEDDIIDDGEHVNYVSEYTEEEHITRISEIKRVSTEKNWSVLFSVLREYTYDWNGYKRSVSQDDVWLKDFTVEIVYSIYDSDPEYFLLQVEGEKAKSLESVEIPTDIWYLGMIRNDSYSLWEDGVGSNPYVESGNGGAKKYFGSGHYAVDIGDGELKEVKYNKDTDDWNLVALTEDEKSTYGAFNNPCGGLWDYDLKKHVDYVSRHEDSYHTSWILWETNLRFKGKEFYEIGYFGEISLRRHTIETVYSIYDNDPEYCLVQIELAETIKVEGSAEIPTDELWYIILIQNDEYYIWDCGYGLNPYAASGFGDSVKYHAFGHYAVQTGENELTEVIYNEETGVWEQHVLTDAEKRIYGEYNDATDCDLYYKE